MIVKYADCDSLALVIQHVKRMFHIISYLSAACLAAPHFSTWSHKRNYFR